MSSQVPVWFWRRMSRLTADQVSRGDDGAPGAGEIASLMRVNLAEGCGAVNAATHGLFCLSRLSGLSGWSGLSCLFCCLTHTRQTR